MNKDKKGFTLIELLVVIAVIGVLISVVLASLTTARNKAADKGAISDLNNIRVQANLYYTGAGAGTYGSVTAACNAGMFSADATIALAITHATTNSTAIACAGAAQSFAAAVTLKTGTGYYCVDSTNAGRLNTTATGLSGAGATNALNTTTGLCS